MRNTLSLQSPMRHDLSLLLPNSEDIPETSAWKQIVLAGRYLEDIPEANISLRLAGYPIEVIEMKDNMVKTLRVIPEFYRNEETKSSE